MKVLGIDQSFTSTGYVILDDLMLIKYDIISSNPDDDIFTRGEYITSKLKEIAKYHRPDLIGVEGIPFGMKGNATRDLSGLQFSIVISLHNEYNVIIVNPTAVKKFASGKGNSKKDDLYNLLPTDIKNELNNQKTFKKSKGLYDITDAFWIARYVYEKNLK